MAWHSQMDDRRRRGLATQRPNRPSVVTASSAEYFGDQDLLAQWLDDCCERNDKDSLPTRDTLPSLIASWRN